MELWDLRGFLAVAEELQFARAAARRHIERSPLSRAIKKLEEKLGMVLFARTTRSTRLTRAGKVFREHVPRIFAALQRARHSGKAAANGFLGRLRIALTDRITPSRLPALLALCREENQGSKFVWCRCRSRSTDCTTAYTTWASLAPTKLVIASSPCPPGTIC